MHNSTATNCRADLLQTEYLHREAAPSISDFPQQDKLIRSIITAILMESS
jgi:hypothetical protein